MADGRLSGRLSLRREVAVPLMPGDAASPSPVKNPTPAKRWAAKRSPTAPTFAHASEAEFARILDFYQVRWEYEPHVFPILWTLEGSVAESFSPDFYLPDFDTYLELTTLRQPLVRKKNRKLRRLRELYPDIRIKLLYARDFRALMLKYGKFGLVDALSGTSGQVPPPAMQEPLEVPEGEPTVAAAAEPTASVPTARPPRRRRRRSLASPSAARVAEA